MAFKYAYFFVTILAIVSGCESRQVQTPPVQKELTPMQKLAELSKAAIAIKIYSIVEHTDSLRPSYLPDGNASLRRLETGEIYPSQIAENNINIFLDLPPGEYQLFDIRYDDPLSYAVANWFFQKLNDKRIQLPQSNSRKLQANDPLLVIVKPRKLQYGGDFSIVFSKGGTKTAPPDFENEENDMKKASEMILARYPHSRWAKEALKVLGIENNF